VLHEDFLKHNSQRILKFNPTTDFPIISALRVQKYEDKGLIGFITSPFILAIVCLCIGYLLNFIAIQANGGHMPVFASNTYFSGYTTIESIAQDKFYILGDHTSKAIPLCDTIDIFYSNLSIGDVFVRCYTYIILFFSIKFSNKKQK
jgi:hypothetical protein